MKHYCIGNFEDDSYDLGEDKTLPHDKHGLYPHHGLAGEISTGTSACVTRSHRSSTSPSRKPREAPSISGLGLTDTPSQTSNNRPTSMPGSPAMPPRRLTSPNLAPLFTPNLTLDTTCHLDVDSTSADETLQEFGPAVNNTSSNNSEQTSEWSTIFHNMNRAFANQLVSHDPILSGYQHRHEDPQSGRRIKMGLSIDEPVGPQIQTDYYTMRQHSTLVESNAATAEFSEEKQLGRPFQSNLGNRRKTSMSTPDLSLIARESLAAEVKESKSTNEPNPLVSSQSVAVVQNDETTVGKDGPITGKLRSILKKPSLKLFDRSRKLNVTNREKTVFSPDIM